MIYTVTFNPALDYVMYLPEVVPGQVNRSSGEALYYGGKGINVATVLHRLGVEVTALGFVAGFTGSALQAGLAALGVPTDFICLPDGMTRINVKLKADRETDLNAQGPAIDALSIEKLYDRLDRLGAEDWVVLAGSIPNCLPADIYERILARLSGKGVRFVVDATGDLLARVLRYRPFLIKPNKQELGELFGETLCTTDEVVRRAKDLQAQGARNVLVSMAGEGAVLLTEEGACHTIGTAHGAVVNSVGAGDSMVAGFLAGYLSAGDYLAALRLGTAAGSATAFSEGLAQREDIDRLLGTL